MFFGILSGVLAIALFGAVWIDKALMLYLRENAARPTDEQIKDCVMRAWKKK